jgi:tetratricopeptide (TPR) repeat protein
MFLELHKRGEEPDHVAVRPELHNIHTILSSSISLNPKIPSDVPLEDLLEAVLRHVQWYSHFANEHLYDEIVPMALARVRDSARGDPSGNTIASSILIGVYEAAKTYHWQRADFTNAIRCAEEVIRLYHEQGNVAQEAAHLALLGQIYSAAAMAEPNSSWLDEVEPTFAKAASLAQVAGNQTAEALALSQLAAHHSRLGRLDEAETLLQQCVELHRESNNPTGEAIVLLSLADILMARGEYLQAKLVIVPWLEGAKGNNIRWEILLSLYLGRIHLECDEFDEAEKIFSSVVERHLEEEIVPHLGEAYLWWGSTYVKRWSVARAARVDSSESTEDASLVELLMKAKEKLDIAYTIRPGKHLQMLEESRSLDIIETEMERARKIIGEKMA